MRLVRLAMLVGILVAMVAPAQGETLVLQNGLAGYTGVEDTYWDNWSAGDEPSNKGGAGNLLFYSTIVSTPRKMVVSFGGLDTTIPVSSANVISARLNLFQYTSMYPHSNEAPDDTAIYRVRRTWEEGTSGGFYSHAVDGATMPYSEGARHVPSADWTYAPGPGGEHVYSFTLPAGTVDKVMQDRSFGAQNWQAAADMAGLYADSSSWYQSGTTVYVHNNEANATTNPTDSSHGCGYFIAADKWNAPGCTGAADIDQGPGERITVNWPDLIWNYAGYTGGDLANYEGEAGWVEVDITAWVQGWMDDPGSNFGVLLAREEGGNYIYTTGRVFFSSEVGLFDPVGRKVPYEYQYDANRAIQLDETYGPKLIIEFERPPVSEPAGLSLVGLALLAIRRKRS